ncbi:Exodeoxyribonuclease VII small subunit [Bosea sp. LC85]|uniref:winged helix-turn-helix transcriptional regulator n=1 Tax=Bosea sp. LC85 TaxID=1502851 RepID=UPI0004E3B8C6|nr:helix-turn-helix domain-containing protein [Bosea sp. LC85]KFC73835.1 Exodeoxyribonuclease VII small subunit [Bosea sp. LC85]
MVLKIRKNRAKNPPPTCAVGTCMQVLGKAWTPNVIWYLSAGPRRFGELRHDMPLISAKMLSERLRDLESRGIVERRILTSSPPSAEYGLTGLGLELMPAIEAIVAVGQRLKERMGQAAAA